MVIGVLPPARVEVLKADELEATEEGLPATDLRPDSGTVEAAFGDKEEEETDMVVLKRC